MTPAGKGNCFICRCCKWLFKKMGWQLVGEIPVESSFVMIVYPHTSLLDFLFGFLLFRSMSLKFYWTMSTSRCITKLFKWIKYLNGICVDRKSAQDFVLQMKEYFEKDEQFIVLLSPEKTRKRGEYWRTGFYYTALACNVPIALAFLDYPSRTGGFGPLLWPSGNIEADFETIRIFYKGIQGRNPDRQNPITIRKEEKKIPSAFEI